MFYPALVVTVEAEQSPRRVLASRRLLFTAVGVPRFDPGPEGEGGRAQNAEKCGFRWSPSACGVSSGLPSATLCH